MNNLWSKEFELEKYWWDKVMANPALIAEYNAEFEKHKAYFKLNSYEFNGTTIDIGGGAFGGVFNFLPIKGRKILADPLAYEFKERYNKIPAGVEIINAYCKDMVNGLPLPPIVKRYLSVYETETSFGVEQVNRDDDIEGMGL